ncbi:uncharacterized protein [Montipora capricornis]|uniref:uncharacterized protein isoform X2 n=1 Tax=Montipora capricornis TaxID=246305 RepID=UPI0035F1D0A9
MIHCLLAVCLLFSLTAGMNELQRSTTSARHHFCTCKDRAVRIEVMEFLAVPCDEICSDRNKEGFTDTSRRNPLQLRRPRVRRQMNKKEYECLIKIKADPGLIVRNVNVTFREKGNNQSWYAVIQWTPLAFPEPWDGYCLNYFGSFLGSSVEPKSSFFSKNTTRIKISPSWKEKEIHVVIFGLSTFANDTDQLQTVLFRSPKVTSNTSMSNGLRHIRTRRGINTKEDGFTDTSRRNPLQLRRPRVRRQMNKKEYECLIKIKADPRLIVRNVNVTFREKGNNQSWYAVIQWTPLAFPEPWDGYCLNYFGSFLGSSVEPKSSFFSKNTTRIKISPSWKEKEIHVVIFGLSTFGNDTDQLQTVLFRSPKVTSNTSMSNGLRHIPTRRGLNTKEDECLAKIRTDRRLIVGNINVTFHEEGKDSNKSWYAFVQWEPIDFPGKLWDGYCLHYFGGYLGASFNPKTSFVLKNTTNRRITPSWKTKDIHIVIFGLSKFGNDTELLTTRIFRPPRMTEDVPRVATKDKPVTLPPPPTDVPHVSTKGEPLNSPSPTTDVPHVSTKDPSNRVKFVFIVVGTMGGIALVVSFLWFFLRRKKSNPPLPHDFKYHAFIIYSREDEHWMKRTLLPLLEDKLHLTCCIHYKDFIPGKPIRDNMADSVYTSYKVIAIFSSNFVNSNYCKYELDVAVNRLVQKRDNSLAIIRIDGADCNKLPSELRGRCFIDYYFRHERPFWKRRLLRFFDFPEESRRQSTAEDQGSNNNNDENRHDNRRVDFKRLQSVQSNVSEISFL